MSNCAAIATGIPDWYNFIRSLIVTGIPDRYNFIRSLNYSRHLREALSKSSSHQGMYADTNINDVICISTTVFFHK